MPTHILTDVKDTGPIFRVRIQNTTDTDYLLWQRAEDSSIVRFEWDEGTHSGDDIVTECNLDRDGIHLALMGGELIHFYFNAFPKHDWDTLANALEKMYAHQPGVLFVCY